MDNFFILVIVLQILGVLICIKSRLIQKAASEIDAKICNDKELSYEEFDKIRKEKVWKPKRKSDYLTIFGIILLNLPIGLYCISRGSTLIATIIITVMIFSIAIIWKNRW